MAKDPGRVLIFDTTLRDGEQSPGASLNLEEKLAIAQQLARLGVDVIEAGFPFASPGDFAAVQRIAQQVGGDNGPIICGLARASRADIKACADAVAPAPRRRIHTFIATSDIHLEHKLRKSRADVLGIVPEMVSYARSLVEDVEFSCEDAGRSDPEFLYEVIEAAIAAGATTINIPDTVGYTTPSEFGALIAGHQSARAQHRRCRDLGAWPQRSRPGRGQFPRGRQERRPSARMHDQWHRRTGRQCLPRGVGDGAARATSLLQPLLWSGGRTAPRR